MSMPKCFSLNALILVLLVFTVDASEKPRWRLLINDPSVSSVAEGDDYYWAGTKFGLSRVSKTGEEPLVYHHSNSALVSDGISHICRSSRTGEFWVGTSAGVQRFDGHTFYPPEELPEIPYAEITAMAVDSLGRVWLARGSTKNSHVRRFGYIDTSGEYRDALLQFPGFPSALAKAPVTNIECDRNGGVWASAVGGHEETLAYLRNGRWRVYSELVCDITLDGNDGLWIMGMRNRHERTTGLGYITPEGALEWLDPGTVPFDTDEMLGIFTGRNGTGVLVQAPTGFFLYSESEWIHIPVGLEGRASALCLSDGTILLHSGKNARYFGRVDNVARMNLHRINEAGTLEDIHTGHSRTPQTRFRNIVSGQSGSVWSLGDRVWHYMGLEVESRESPTGGYTMAASPDGSIYVGYRGGIRIYDATGHQDYEFDENYLFVANFAFDGMNRAVFLTCTMEFDKMYAVRFDAPNLEFLDSTALSGRIGLHRRAVMGPDSTLWVQSSDELITFSLKTQIWGRRSGLETDAGVRDRFNGIGVDSAETIWVGSDNGFVKVDHASGDHTVLGARDSGKAHAEVHCVGPDGSVWGIIASGHTKRPARIHNDSLIVYESDKDPFLGWLEAATVDAVGNVWYSTRDGIVIFNPEGLTENLTNASIPHFQVRAQAQPGRMTVTPAGGNRIRAVLPVTGMVECRVYDSRGRAVSHVNYGRLSSGTYILRLFSEYPGEYATSVLFACIEITGMDGNCTRTSVRVPMLGGSAMHP